MIYGDFTARNSGLISKIVQEELRNKRILICGCGIGSYLAEALLRMGCINLKIVDMDIVSLSNLNRQNYKVEDIDKPKVFCLKNRLQEIYPEANIQAVNEPLSKTNVKALVSDTDIIIDTIDYLDLQAILLLHKEAILEGKHLISAMSIGFGAGLFYFPPFHIATLEGFIEQKMGMKLDRVPYYQAFAIVVESLLPHFNKDVQEMLGFVIQQMKEHKPCPASQVAAGTMCCASLVTTCVEHIIRGEMIDPFPKFHYLDLHKVVRNAQGPTLSI